MRISAIRCLLLSAPYATPGDAEREVHLSTGYRSAGLIQVTADDGTYGLGESYAGVYAPEAVRELTAQFAQDLVGEDPLEIAELRERLRRTCYYWGRFGLAQSVVGAIEMALWDLMGKTLNLPVHALLGGALHDRLPVYASGGNPKPRADLKSELEEYLDAGFRAVKIRINHMSVPQIVETVAFAKEVLGTGAGLAVDAAQGLERHPWPIKKALEVVRLLEPHQLLWIEEPAEVTNYEGLREIRRQSATTIAGGETTSSLVEVEAYLRADSLDLYQMDAALIGGLSTFRQAAEMCQRKFLPVAVHAWSGGAGIMGNYHAAFASKNCAWLELPTVPNPLRDELLVEPLRIVEGSLPLPTAPGLGVHLPEGIEQRYPYRPGSFYRILGPRA